MVLSRRQQIEAQLQKHGITPDESHVNAVLEILKADQRATVASATRRYAQQLNPQPEVEADNPQQQMGAGHQDLGEAANYVADRIVEEVVGTAYDIALHRIASGDWGTIRPSTRKKLEDFKRFVKTDLKVIDVNFSSAALLTSQQNLLPSSSETESELVTQ